MQFNKSALYKACHEVASNTLWDLEPPVPESVQDLANKYFEIAKDEIESRESLCSDPDVVVRAVKYLSHAHAIPPMKTDIAWFYNMLEALMELVCPNIIHTDSSSEIFRDIEKGMIISREPTEIEISESDKNKIDKLLDEISPSLKKKKVGAWITFKSDNPDKLSQATNSMVELLDQVIKIKCKESAFSDFLTHKFKSDKEIKWIESTRKWIGDTKSNLQRIKHYDDYTSENMVERLLKISEEIILLLLS